MKKRLLSMTLAMAMTVGLLAGCSGDTSLIPLLMPLLHHPSPAVSTHAAWALSRLQEGISFLSEL